MNKFELLEDEEKDEKPPLLPELWKLFQLAWPTTLRLLGYMFTFTVVTVIIGNKVGVDALAAAATGLMYHNAFGVLPFVGMCSALDTLCSQEYGRDPKSPLLGVLMQRGMVGQSVLFIVCAMFQLNAAPILGLFIDQQLAEDAGVLCAWLTPGLLPFMFVEVVSRFMTAHGDAIPAMVNSIMLLATSSMFSWLFIVVVGWDLKGAGVALSVARSLQFVLLWIFLITSPRYKDTYHGINVVEAFNRKGLWEFAKLGTTSMVSMIMESDCWEFLQFWASLISPVTAAAEATMLNTLTIFYMPIIGVRIGLSIRIGNLFGANKPIAAKWVWRYSLLMCVTMAIINGVLIIAGRNFMPKLYTDNPDVSDQVSKAAVVLACFHVGDALQEMGNGLCIGLGKQQVTVGVMLFTLWVLGVPLSYFFGVHLGYGLAGLWGGFGIGVVSAVPVYFFIIWKQDWVAIAAETADRLKRCAVTEAGSPNETEMETPDPNLIKQEV